MVLLLIKKPCSALGISDLSGFGFWAKELRLLGFRSVEDME